MSFKILMVDDEDRFNALYEEIITQEFDAQINFAKNGLEALEALDADGSYDLIILDLDMPKLDGKSTLIKLRMTPKHVNIPIFILTANASDDNQKLLLNLGANDFISKGCSPELFTARLKNLIAYQAVVKDLNRTTNNYNYMMNETCLLFRQIVGKHLTSMQEALNTADSLVNQFFEKTIPDHRSSLKLVGDYFSSALGIIEKSFSQPSLEPTCINRFSKRIRSIKAMGISHEVVITNSLQSRKYFLANPDLVPLLIIAIINGYSSLPESTDLVFNFQDQGIEIVVSADKIHPSQTLNYLSTISSYCGFNFEHKPNSVHLWAARAQ